MKSLENLFEKLVFASRWFQLPMYIGLIVAGVLYAWKIMASYKKTA